MANTTITKIIEEMYPPSFGMYTKQEFTRYYTSAVWHQLRYTTLPDNKTFTCSDFSATFAPCPFPYTGTGACNTLVGHQESVYIGRVLQRVIFVPYFMFLVVFMMKGTVLPLLKRIKDQGGYREANVNATEQLNAMCVGACIIYLIRLIDNESLDGIIPYVVNDLLINLAVADLICLLFILTNSWVAVMSATGKNIKVPTKWRVAKYICATICLLNAIISSLVYRSVDIYDTPDDKLAPYFGAATVTYHTGFYSGTANAIKSIINSVLLLGYATVCTVYGLQIKKELQKSNSESGLKAVKQIMKYQYAVWACSAVGAGYWMMTAIQRFGIMVPTDRPCSVIGGLLDTIMIIFAFCASIVCFIMKPKQKHEAVTHSSSTYKVSTYAAVSSNNSLSEGASNSTLELDHRSQLK